MNTRTLIYWAQILLTLVTCAFLVIPVVQSVLAGFTLNYFKGITGGMTFKWIGEVMNLYADTIGRSLIIAFACLILNLLIGVPAAYVMVKHKNRFTRLVEELLVVPLAVPGLAIALGILITYGQWTEFRKSTLIILTGHLIFTLPFMVRSVIAVMASFNLEELEESAASLGAGFWKRFFSIAVPNSVYGILSGALMVFTLSVGEFNLTWMLHTPLTKTLPVGLADSYASMRLEIGAAYTSIFLLLIIPMLMLMQWAADSPEKIRSLMLYGKQTMLRPLSFLLNGDVSEKHENVESVKSKEKGTHIRLVNCRKTFPDGTVGLNTVNLSITPGETIVVLGPSGCGKTTLLRIMAGLETPDVGGNVFFNDEDVTGISIEERNVGMVFQSYALFPNMTAAQNIVYGLKIRGDDRLKQEARLREMLDMMKITPLKDRRIHQLSGGQKQRVALARAIAVRPRILLLDEPLTALDARLRDELRVDIDILLKKVGITAVYVTHDQAEAMALGDRIVVMNKGCVSQVGTPKEIYFRPRNPFTASFVGAINRLRAVRKNGVVSFLSTSLKQEEVPRIRCSEGVPFDIYFRPEHARVTTTENGHIIGVVENAIFVGDRTRLTVTCENANVLQVEAPGKTRCKAGDAVGIQLDLNEIFTMEEST